MKRFLLIILALTTVLSSNAQYNFWVKKRPKYEVRAVWLTTIGGLDWPHSYAMGQASIARQKRELTEILDKLQQAGVNQVLLQTRIRATTIYPSRYEPWDGCLSGRPGTSPGYDALAFATSECHKRGMELHAWVVTMPIGKWNGYGCRQLRKRHPDLVRRIGDEAFMNPEKAETATYIADICEEITRNYDIDGIHLDYIRYPETWKIKGSGDRERANITRIVSATSLRVKAQKPYVKISCAPIGKFDDLTRFWSYGWNAYSRVCQDAQGWLRDGLMDELLPMMYFQGRQFFPFAIDWSENTYGRIVAPGLGIYFLSANEKNWSLDVITREMEVLRRLGLGHAFFRSKFLTDNAKGIYTFTARQFDVTPALVPPMTWESKTRPEKPWTLKVEGQSVSWQGRKGLLYNVYSSKSYPVDINDGNNLVKVRTRETSVRVPVDDDGRYYAITSTDRFGNESEPAQMSEPKKVGLSQSSTMLKSDGRNLLLPRQEPTDDADMLIVEDLKGKQVAIFKRQAGAINISRLDNGMYVLLSLNRRGVTHRIGFFKIKR